MELTYPPEAEAFRSEIRAWLEENLPEGWFEPDFEMTPEERRGLQRGVAPPPLRGRLDLRQLAGGVRRQGPQSIMENVVLAEEFARAKAPLRADFFGDTLVGPTILQWGTEEQKKEFLPKIQRGEMRWCQGFSEPNSGSDLASLKTTRRPRRRRVGHQRPEGVDHAGPVRRLHLPARPHRPGRRPSTRASRTSWCP